MSERKRLLRGASNLLRRVRVVSYTGTWDEKEDGSQQKQSHLYMLLLPPDILSSFLSSLTVSSFSLSTIWLVEDQDRLLSTTGIYFPIDSQVYSFYTRQGRVQIDEVYQVTCLFLLSIQPFCKPFIGGTVLPPNRPKVWELVHWSRPITLPTSYF